MKEFQDSFISHTSGSELIYQVQLHFTNLRPVNDCQQHSPIKHSQVNLFVRSVCVCVCILLCIGSLQQTDPAGSDSPSV